MADERLYADRNLLQVKTSAASRAPYLDAPFSLGHMAYTLRQYLLLTKPRIELLIIISTAVGYCYGVASSFNVATFVNVLVGTALMAAGSATLNQWYERDTDAKMKRTSMRPIPTGALSPRHALVFGLAVSTIGFFQLAVFVNLLAAFLGFLTLAGYLFAYTPLKRRGPISTTVGAFPGAMPPLIGFAAASGQLTLQAWVLFAILFLWQFPHFHAIAWLYQHEYQKVGIKMLAVVKPQGTGLAWEILLSLILLIPATLAPTLLHLAGKVYFVAACFLNVAFLYFGVRMTRDRTNERARRLLLASVLYLPALFAFLVLSNPRFAL
jgi:protoheme IX farnesyltransferase